MIDLTIKTVLSLVSKIVGDKWSSSRESKKAEKNLKSYIDILSVDIDAVTIIAFELWETSFKHTDFKLYFKGNSQLRFPQDFYSERIKGYFDICKDSLDETLRVTINALLRHITNYCELKHELILLSYDFDKDKSYNLYIETLYIRRYIMALSSDWGNVTLLTTDHTHKQLSGTLGLPVDINELRAKVIDNLQSRT
ncbi:hypothetical protein [Photobacterium phosphoreum]|uniref:hypothetical protein n=1 Tax=Photobacterium phosphoreum TaxID=659 RepID=UPI001E37EC4D|nr:hypothetical protein [Photobacterium phosphoreum]MCD9481580.1 hypothetical protein [Photobacterium phosphoreum]